MVEAIKSINPNTIESKFPLIKGEELGKMHLCELGTGEDGVTRTAAKMVVKAGFHWTEW